MALPDKKICSEKELYFRTFGKAVVCGGIIKMEAGCAVSFDTYFNSLSSFKLKKYTIVSSVTLSVRVSGKGIVQLCSRDNKRVITLAEQDFDGEGITVRLTAGLSDVSGTILYPVVKAETGCVLEDFCFESAAEPHKIRLALVICTYKREEYVYRNLRLMQENGLHNTAFVIDNGKTLKPERISYPYAELCPNKNYGGSGGFTRGLIEVHSRGEEFTHVLLMDDDITIDCSAIKKTEVFLSILKPEYKSTYISGSMLQLDMPYLQYECGARWADGRISSLKQGLDLRIPENLTANETEEQIDYGAWWYMCMPSSVVSEYGLPFPFFIKTDDIEYGVRTADSIVTLPGIAVWHEPFDKKYSDHLDYYIKRNELVMNSIHSRHPKLLAYRNFFYTLTRYMLTYNYDSITFLCRAYDDFFKGPDFFLNADDEKINTEIMGRRYNLKNDDQLEAEHSMCFDEQTYLCSCRTKYTAKDKVFIGLMLGGYIIPGCFFHRGYNVAGMTASPLCYFRWKRVLQYNCSEKKGKPVEMKRSMLFKAIALFVKYMCRITFCYDRVRRSYQRRMNEITSVSFWTEHLGIRK